MPYTSTAAYVGVELDDIEPASGQPTDDNVDQSSLKTLLDSKNQRGIYTPVSDSLQGTKHRLSTQYLWRFIRFHTTTFFTEGFRELGAANSRHHAYQCCILLWPLLFVGGLLSILPVITSKKRYRDADACQPDSGFSVGYGTYNIWALSGFFQITLGFGRLSFSAAKALTVSWDIILGRGGQALMVWISYIVYSKALVRSMESSPVTYGTFEAVTLQSGSLVSLLKLTRDFATNRTLQARFAMVWMIISGIFVLSFQTLISAMAGYTANIDAYVQLPSGSMEPYSSFSTVRYIIHDAHRINGSLTKDFMVRTSRSDWGDTVHLGYGDADACELSWYPRETTNSTDNSTVPDWQDAADPWGLCDFYWHVSEYGFKYGFLGMNNVSSEFNNSGKLVHLDPPTLNISAIFWNEEWLDSMNETKWYYWPYGFNWRTPSGDYPFHNTSTSPIFSDGEYSYDLEELNLHGKCQQLDTSYKWGFSFLVLFIVILTFSVWCLGMYILWLDAWLNSRFDRAGRTMGLHRAVLDLATCINQDIDEDGRDTMSNKDLHDKIRKVLKGGQITYAMLDEKWLPISRGASLRLWWLDKKREWPAKREAKREALRRLWPKTTKLWRETNKKDFLKHWVPAHKYTLPLFLCSLGFLSAALAGTHAPLLTAVVTLVGSSTALFLDQAPKGKWIIFLFCAALAAALIPAGPFVYLDQHHYTVLWGINRDPYYAISWWYNH
ncbi:hypothetical protein PV08_09506 [Exophiala spinifera]|uniref:Uncharacterized protein n=1 Tax=Exophiala spinifera TaxID=91928 RepID=A0A0D2B0I7_9EURO|nr:uncharacterized protein PV08_09506 [Exophiala spinifera]KIW12230.1 hypothetical protein PV08_09506 [Exophiala spinifera]